MFKLSNILDLMLIIIAVIPDGTPSNFDLLLFAGCVVLALIAGGLEGAVLQRRPVTFAVRRSAK